MATPTHAAAAAELAGRDPVMRGLVEAVGPPDLRRPQRSAFEALTRSICFQQLSGKAAATIYGRFEVAVGGEVTPEAVLATPAEDLRRAGLSAAKTLSILDLAEKVLDGTVPIGRLGRLDDDELVARLVVVRGIGRWTAEMFLIFQLRRLDVWPVDDLGVRKGYARAYGLEEAPAPRRLAELGDSFRPYRSVAAWYCWRAIELEQLPG
ncbi:MAG TPA: DNA-3-methyladenine glycosylase 2 family protein [Acidimicrobiales bacterium]|nr:DNA-3-methyladenine glycosylase 2 family protein [Acidimicrobiales bacterium]